MLETDSVLSARLAGISEEIEDLRRRVTALERKAGAPAGLPAAPHTVTPTPPVPPLPSAGLATVLGRAVLGVAGAYLLRAAFESGAIPASAAAAAAVIYAMWWLRLARNAASREAVAVNIYAATAAAIVYPMLWEMTVRFRASPAAFTAMLLVVFAAAGLAAAWKANLNGLAWITALGAVATAFALLLATHHVLAFSGALLAIAAIVEISACRDHWLHIRGAASFAAGLAVLLALYLIANPRGLPEGYAPFRANDAVLLSLLLLLVTLGGAMVRTLVRGLDVTRLEAAQTAMAIALAVGGSLRVAGRAGAMWTGAAVILGAAASYLVSFAYLDRKSGRNRNFYTYSTLALILATAGGFILLHGAGLTALWTAAAAAATWIGVRWDRSTVRLHGVFYLLLAGHSSGAFAASMRRIVGDGAGWTGDHTLLLAASAVCYVLARRGGVSSSRDAYSACCIAAMLLLAAAGLLAGFGAAFSFPLRTAMLASTAVLLAWAGKRWRRQELTWLVYPCMSLAAYRLAVQDFPRATPAGFAASLLFFGGALILLPRILRAGRA